MLGERWGAIGITLEQMLWLLDAQGCIVRLMSPGDAGRDGTWLCIIDAQTGRGTSPVDAVLSAMFRQGWLRGATHLPRTCDACSLMLSGSPVTSGERMCPECKAESSLVPEDERTGES